MFLAFIPQLALAENTPAPVAAKVIKGDFKTMKHTSSNRVDTVIDAHTLPNIQMPNRNGFVADPRPDVR